MFCFSAFLLALGLATAIPNHKLHPLSDEFIQRINSRQSTWKAGRNFEIEEYELVKILASGVQTSDVPRVYEKIHNEDDDVPDFFDSREAWPECADIIGLIRDQSKCGSSWALGAAEAMSDRICIHSNATKKLLISGQDLLTCGHAGGCDGGDPYNAWSAWKNLGVVTGGLYNHTEQGCKSYFLPPCDDHPHKCTSVVQTPECLTSCEDPSLDYNAQKTYGLRIPLIFGEKQIQLEILKNGPVEAGFNAKEDFLNYKSGIYQAIEGGHVGCHAVKILGWGVENGTKYWLVANSWNERWGENGYFRIIRGQNEADIEDVIYSALPDFSRF